MTKLIDDAYTSKVQKVGKWGQVQGAPDDFNHTLSYTETVGDSMKVTFNGTFIVVFGHFDSESTGVVTNYSMDGAPPAQVTTPLGEGEASRQQFWATNGLARGSHTLTITMDKLNANHSLGYSPGGGTVWFDYFYVDDSNTDVPDAPPNPDPSKHSSSLPTGIIVGIVIGALLVLLGALGILLMWRRMKRDLATYLRDKQKFTVKEEPSIEPFTFDPNLFVREPLGVNSGKSTLVMMQDDSGVPVRFSLSGSTETSSSTLAIDANGLPPGAQPAMVPPISKPSIPFLRRSLVRPSTIHLVASTDATPTPGFDPLASGADTSHVAGVPSSTDSEGDIPAFVSVTRQHLDSGVRSAGVILAHNAQQKRVDLPPVYSPV